MNVWDVLGQILILPDKVADLSPFRFSKTMRHIVRTMDINWFPPGFGGKWLRQIFAYPKIVALRIWSSNSSPCIPSQRRVGFNGRIALAKSQSTICGPGFQWICSLSFHLMLGWDDGDPGMFFVFWSFAHIIILNHADGFCQASQCIHTISHNRNILSYIVIDFLSSAIFEYYKSLYIYIYVYQVYHIYIYTSNRAIANSIRNPMTHIPLICLRTSSNWVAAWVR